MQLRQYIFISFLFVSYCFGANAQLPEQGEITYDNISIVREGSNLKISMDINLTNLDLASNSTLVVSPEIWKGEYQLPLEKIDIAGKRQYIYKKRNHTDPLPIRFSKKNPQIIKYAQSVPFSSWMREAQLSVTENTCGCLDELTGMGRTDIATVNVPSDEFVPVFAYITPVSVTKTQSGKISLNISFPSGKSTLLPDFKSNQSELVKMKEFVDKIKENELFILKNVVFHGYASPEGSYSLNTRLANERVSEVARYASRTLELPSSAAITTEFTAEDWEGVKKFLEESTLSDKTTLLDIINSGINPDNMEKKIRSEHATSYRYLLENVFPSLRRTECLANYEIRDLTMSECEELFKTQPSMLSLNEFYRLAEKYPNGSDEFNEVFDVAVRMFPDDAVANLNAANVAIMKKQWKDAEKYLNKTKETPESLNARGIFQALTGNSNSALEYFQKAANGGLQVANDNLKKLQEIIQFQ